MKLYTEEQVRQAYIDGMDFIAVDPTMYEQDADEYMREVHSIELPSDEEIYHSAINWVFHKNSTKWSTNDDTAGDNMGSFINGAKWMRDKLTNAKEK